MIDQEKVGKFIADLRKEKGLTQDDLAEKIFVGREAISKWERGVCIPGQTILLSLSEEFNVSINEILYGERKNNKNSKVVENTSFNWFLLQLKRIKKYIVIAFIFFLACFTIIYFVQDYNSFKILTTYVNGDSFTVNKGLIVRCREKLYFQFGSVINHTDYDITSINLYYGADENKIKLASGSNINDIVVNKNDLEKSTNKSIKDIYNNLYLEINTDELTELYKVNVTVDFRATLFKNEEEKTTTEAHIEPYSNDFNNNKDIRDKFVLIKGEYVYEFNYKDKKYKCILEENTINLKTTKYVLTYRIDNESIKINSSKKNIVFNTKSNMCESDNCEDYMNIINMFVNNVIS